MNTVQKMTLVVRVLKERFNNLNAEELVELAGKIVLALEEE